jgi:hypothetical protein
MVASWSTVMFCLAAALVTAAVAQEVAPKPPALCLGPMAPITLAVAAAGVPAGAHVLAVEGKVQLGQAIVVPLGACLQVIGTDATTDILTGAGEDRLFIVEGALVLQDVALTGGRALSPAGYDNTKLQIGLGVNGGAIAASADAFVTLTRVALADNVAAGSGTPLVVVARS